VCILLARKGSLGCTSHFPFAVVLGDLGQHRLVVKAFDGFDASVIVVIVPGDLSVDALGKYLISKLLSRLHAHPRGAVVCSDVGQHRLIGEFCDRCHAYPAFPIALCDMGQHRLVG